MRLVDLTHPITNDIPAYFPWHPKTLLTPTTSYAENGCLVHRLTIGTHTGTHIDAPAHFYEGATTIDQIDLSLLVSEAVVLDCTDKTARAPITAEDLQARGVEDGRGVIIHTGWFRHHGKPDYYQTYPPLSDDAGAFLLARRVPYVAADTPYTVPFHVMMLKEGRILITNLNALDHLRERRVRLYAFPLKLAGIDGAPARVIAEDGGA